MSERAFDAIVVGAGPGGYVAAIRAAQLGLSTAIVERDALGGRCLNHACIPAKAVLRAADVLSEVRHAGDFGIVVAEPEIDFAAIQARRAEVVATLTGGVAGLLRKNKVELVEGTARLAGPGALAVGDELLRSERIVLATGSVGQALPGVQLGGRIVGTEQAWALPELPARIAVVGAGASGVELASAYARLGVDVLLLEAFERILPAEDAAVSALVQRDLERQGARVVTGTALAGATDGAAGVEISYGAEAETVDWLVLAAGRRPDSDALGLAEAGVAVDERGLVAVDGRQRTSVAGVWAIGDLTPGPALAHKASEEGLIAVEDAAGHQPEPLVHADVPRATFCQPTVASFGLTEEQARAAGHDVVVGEVRYGAVGAGATYGDRGGVVKVVGERTYGELLGGHVVGSKSTEMIQELVNVRALEGGFQELARIVHAHPTLSEAVSEAARAADGWLIHG